MKTLFENHGQAWKVRASVHRSTAFVSEAESPIAAADMNAPMSVLTRHDVE
jgi:hypothetical protein